MWIAKINFEREIENQHAPLFDDGCRQPAEFFVHDAGCVQQPNISCGCRFGRLNSNEMARFQLSIPDDSEEKCGINGVRRLSDHEWNGIGELAKSFETVTTVVARR